MIYGSVTLHQSVHACTLDETAVAMLMTRFSSDLK